MPISSVHGHGTGDLLDAVCAHLDFSETVVEEDRIPVAIIGRPNVGKSSLTNRILGENRMIVANEAGTTRDAIDTPVDNAYGKFIFTDTAGLRKRSNITDGLGAYGGARTGRCGTQPRGADPCGCHRRLYRAGQQGGRLRPRAGQGLHHRRQQVGRRGRQGDQHHGAAARDYAECFSFMGYAPIIFISAQTGYNVNKLMQLIRDVDARTVPACPPAC